LSFYRKGKQAELELVKKLRKAGYAVMRAPASGARTKRVFYPDVLAVKFDGKNYRVLVFEVKLRKHRDTIHIAGPKIWLLQDYAKRAGGKAYIAVKISEEKQWFVFPVEMLEQQKYEKGVRYVITKDMFSRAKKLSEVI